MKITLPLAVVFGWEWEGGWSDRNSLKCPKLCFLFIFCLKGSDVSSSGRSGKSEAKSRDGKRCSFFFFFASFIIIIFLMLHTAVMYAKFSAFEMWIGSKYLDLDSK